MDRLFKHKEYDINARAEVLAELASFASTDALCPIVCRFCPKSVNK